MIEQTMFEQYIGIDYSGANTPVARLNGLVVYRAGRDAMPGIVFPDKDHCDLWSRKLLAQWLVEELRDTNKRTLVGIDHAFGFPIDYFNQHPEVPQDNWCRFLTDFREHWPTHEDDALVRDFLGDLDHPRQGDPERLRITDERARCQDRRGVAPAPVFDFNAGARNVAHSTHAGLPWLLYIRQKLREANVGVHFWPFDDWPIPPDQSVIVEIYPRLWNGQFKAETRGMNRDRRDAYCVSRWMSERGRDQNDPIERYFNPGLTPAEIDQARTEGWIFGVT